MDRIRSAGRERIDDAKIRPMDHLRNCLKVEQAKLASFFSPRHAERFVRYLQNLSVTPNSQYRGEHSYNELT